MRRYLHLVVCAVLSVPAGAVGEDPLALRQNTALEAILMGAKSSLRSFSRGEIFLSNWKEQKYRGPTLEKSSWNQKSGKYCFSATGGFCLFFFIDTQRPYKC